MNDNLMNDNLMNDTLLPPDAFSAFIGYAGRSGWRIKPNGFIKASSVNEREVRGTCSLFALPTGCSGPDFDTVLYSGGKYFVGMGVGEDPLVFEELIPALVVCDLNRTA